jgi:hypothetical protein
LSTLSQKLKKIKNNEIRMKLFYAWTVNQPRVN